METIERSMMAAFTAAVLFSLWKIYSFVPRKPLTDDDTTPEATDKLSALMVQCILEAFDAGHPLDEGLLYERMVMHERFDKEHFWRFNQNRLNRLVQRYYLLNPDATSLHGIYIREKITC